MELKDAIDFIAPAIEKKKSSWADIGAGSGIFTRALDHLLVKESSIYAFDLDISALNKMELDRCDLFVEQQDFSKPFSAPMMDGILMANTLHFSENQNQALHNILQILKPGGIFLLLEYELQIARPPWIPFPVPFQKFEALAKDVGLSGPQFVSKRPSRFGHDHIYLAKSVKL